MNKRNGFLLGLGSMAAVLAIGGAALFGGIGVTQQSEALYMTDGPDFKDVHDLTKASQAVVHVHIISAGKTYLVPFDAGKTDVAPARKDDSAKGKLGQPTSATPAEAQLHNGILKTDYTAEVLDNVRGAGLRKGQQIVISQIGGKMASQGADGAPTTITVANAEHDPVMQVGDQELLFLNQDTASGKFFTTGGGQGRFKVQRNGTVAAVDTHSSLARIQTGKSVSSLKNSVQAVEN
jgi:hypothetical protein